MNSQNAEWTVRYHLPTNGGKNRVEIGNKGKGQQEKVTESPPPFTLTTSPEGPARWVERVAGPAAPQPPPASGQCGCAPACGDRPLQVHNIQLRLLPSSAPSQVGGAPTSRWVGCLRGPTPSCVPSGGAHAASGLLGGTDEHYRYYYRRKGGSCFRFKNSHLKYLWAV